MKRVSGLGIIVWTVLFLPLAGYSQRSSKAPSAREIMENAEKEFAAVKDFSVNVEAEVNMERLRVPKSTATMYFKRPDKIQFTSTSFVMVPREGIVPNPAILRERYDATMVGEEKFEGRKHYKLQLAAKEAKTRLRQLYVWVDPSNWTITKIETIPYEGRTLSISLAYGLQQGQYWLPLSLKATFGTVAPDTSKPIFPEGVPASKEQLEELQRPVPRSGTISVVYSGYRVNINLRDSIFEKKE